MRKLRGILKTGLTWAVGWAAGAGILHPLAGLFGAAGLLGNGWLPDIVFAGLIGGFGGAVFATGLALSEDARGLDQIRVLSGLLWGAAAGFAGPACLALLVGDLSSYLYFATHTPLFLVTLTTLGAASGAGMTALARAAAQAELADGPAHPRLPATEHRR